MSNTTIRANTSPTPRRHCFKAFTPAYQSMKHVRQKCAAREPSTAVRATASDQEESLPKTWSNPSGEALRQVAEDIWVAERPFVWFGIDVGSRATLLRLRDGGIVVHSPIHLDAPLRAAVDDIGDVSHIISPNYEHVKYAAEWSEAYPKARAHACPGLREQKPDIAFTDTVGERGATVPDDWRGQIECVYLNYEHNPFNKKPFFNEVVFFHAPSKTLLTTDLFWNYPAADVPWQTWLWKQGMDRVYLPFYKNLMIKERGAYEEAVSTILSWDFERIIPCHGSIVQANGKDSLRRFLNQY